MRVRCPKCTSVNDHPDELGWRKTECPVCSHSFVATKKLVVVTADADDAPTDDPVDVAEDVQPALQLVARKAGSDAARTFAMVIAGGALLVSGLLARTWLVTKYELQGLRAELSELSDLAGTDKGSAGTDAAQAASATAGRPSGDGASTAGTSLTGNVVSVKEKLEADRVLVTLQEAVLVEMQTRAEKHEARIKTLETKFERGENALRREKGAHGKTKQKLAKLLKENMALRRELDACLREMRDTERKLNRGF